MFGLYKISAKLTFGLYENRCQILMFGPYENKCQISIWGLSDFVKILPYRSGLQRCRIVTAFVKVSCSNRLCKWCHVATGFVKVSYSNGFQRCCIVVGFRGAMQQRTLGMSHHSGLQRCRVATGFVKVLLVFLGFATS